MSDKRTILFEHHSRNEAAPKAYRGWLAVVSLVAALLSGCAAMIPAPRPPASVTSFHTTVLSVQKEPVYSSGTQVATRVNVTFQLDDGSTIAAHCEGNLFSGLLLPSGWVCRVPEVGDGYRAWWRNSRQLYVQGRSSNGGNLATLFDVTGR